MKNTFLFLSIGLLGSASCNKDDELTLQPHDENQIMSIMHQMMDSMLTMQPANDADIDFAVMMTMHHQGALDMANLQMQSGTNDSLKNIAQNIITEQQSEIQELNTVLETLTVDDNDPSFAMEQMDNMSKMDAAADVQLITGDIDNDFATLMMVHHQAAMDNASAYLHHGTNEELKMMAKDMIEMQTMEIEELSNWLIANKR